MTIGTPHLPASLFHTRVQDGPARRAGDADIPWIVANGHVYQLTSAILVKQIPSVLCPAAMARSNGRVNQHFQRILLVLVYIGIAYIVGAIGLAVDAWFGFPLTRDLIGYIESRVLSPLGLP
jgi:hypothetical protein